MNTGEPNMPNTAQQTEVAVVTVTPEMAKHWLELNIDGNRKLRKSAIDRYAIHMRNNEWPLTGQPIIFNGDQLIDGQHRLHACVKAGVPFRTLVVRNVDCDAFQYLDLGAKRSMADALRFRNHTNVSDMAAIVRLVMAYEKDFTALSSVEFNATHQQLIDEIENNIDLYSLAANMAMRARRNGFLKSPAGAMYVLLSKRFGQLAADKFMIPAIEGINLAKNDPRLSLRRFITNTKPNAQEQLSGWIKTYNAYTAGKGLQKIYSWKAGQPFPTINNKKAAS